MIGLGTKKLGSVARFEARYGVGIKKRVLKIERKQKQKHVCPNCGFRRAKRKSAGIYQCTKCNSRFAGGAYVPSTMTGRTIQKMVSQKSFLPQLAKLLEVKEKAVSGEALESEAPEFGEEKSPPEGSSRKEKRRGAGREKKPEDQAQGQVEQEGDE